MRNLKENKIINKILILGIIILSILSINCISFADDKIQTNNEVSKIWQGKMPQNSIAGSTGMFPQYYIGTSGRFVNLPGSRLSWTRAGSWTSNMEGNVVYCAEHGAYVRYGNYDPAQHFLKPGKTTIQNVNVNVQGREVGNTLNDILTKTKEYYTNYIKDKNIIYYTKGKYNSECESSVPTLSISISKNFPGGEDAIGYYIIGESSVPTIKDITGVYEAADGAVKDAMNESSANMYDIFENLSHSIWPSHYSTDVDHGSYTEKGITATEGPEFVVLETAVGANDRYTEAGDGSYSNDQKAYILTSLENVYGEKGEYGKKYSLNDMQTAYWLALGQNPSKGTSNGRTLYENSQKYAEFASSGFNASIDTSLAQVIADRGSQSYIVGPFSLNYPDYTAEDICYVKSLSINNGSLIYDETHKDFEVILAENGTNIPGANGMKKHYPKSGEKFFIKFSASSIGYATSVNLSAQFEYISGSNIDFTQLDTYADIWKYYGYCEMGGDYKMEYGDVTIRITYKKRKERRRIL